MRTFRVIFGTIIVLLAAAGMPARAAPAPATGLTRYMFVSDKYMDVVVQLDGREILQQPTNTLSNYIAIASDRPHTLAYYGRGLGIPGGSELVRRIENYRVAVGRTGIEIYRDDGVTLGMVDAPPAPAGKSLLNVIWAPGTAGEVHAGALVFGHGPYDGPNTTRMIEPQTTLLELRAPQSGKLLYSQYLRAQPGYRYEIIVVRSGPTDASSRLVIVPVSPQLAHHPTETRVFAETGHSLEGRLRQYWEATGGLPVVGFPLNDDHLDRTPEGAFVSQVFERTRFEYHSENRAPYDVLLGRLGDERLRQAGRDWRQEWRARPAGPGCETMVTSGRAFAVCEPFRSYYHAHGLEFDGRPGFSAAESLALFGLPLTQAKMETNSSGHYVLTQWFERARLEYHPSNPPAYKVLLGRLGAEVYGLEPLTFDDEDHGFRRASTAGRPDWNEASGGFGGHYWWTCAENLGDAKQNLGNLMAQWVGPRVRGTFEVQVYVPDRHTSSRNVLYEVPASFDDRAGIRLDQQPSSNQWVRLTTMQPAMDVGITIHSNTGEGGGCANQIAADAVRLVPRP